MNNIQQPDLYQRIDFLADTRDEAREDIRAILAAYAMCDNVLLPTVLVAALEQAKRRMG